MRIKTLILAISLTSTVALAQTSDPIIMTINGKPVTRSEFEYSYNKNNTEGVIDKTSIKDYVNLFINYKLKVQAALDAHLDTLQSFKQEFATYRNQQIRPSMITDKDVENEARKIYKETKERTIANGGLIKCAHILLRLNQRASKEEQAILKNRIDSIYAVLKNGADFSSIAKKYSEDIKSAKNGGELPTITRGQTVKVFEDKLFSLKKGEISEPFLSPFGYHIIKMIGKEEIPPYDSVRTNIYQYIDARKIREQIINNKIDSIVKESAGKLTPEKLLTAKLSELEAKDQNLKYLIQEYHDGLLLIEMSSREIWDKAANDEKGLAAYFKKNKKKYKWLKPRFKGIAYHVQIPEDIKAVKKCIAHVPFKDWAERLRTAFNNDSTIRVKVEKGIFKQGDSPLVDREIFKQKVDVKPLKKYPIDAVCGKKLKKPEELDDIRGQVISDYQDELEKEWVENLRKKYKFTINKEVLSTVNKH